MQPAQCTMASPDTALLHAFARQVQWCFDLGCPFTARVLQRSRAWLAADTAAREAFMALTPDPLAGAVALRWAAALHHLALRGLQPWASLWPPSQSEPVSDAALDAALRLAWQTQRPSVDAALAGPPQTNEVRRSAVLLPGLLAVAHATGLPLKLLELGASAGLNLWAERHHYDYGAWQWGDQAASLHLKAQWAGALAPFVAQAVQVNSRAACDVQPVNLALTDEALRLTSFVWADQPERLARLRLATQCAWQWMQAEQVNVTQQTASDFLAEHLHRPAVDHATVVMHSVVWQYIPAAEQARISELILTAGMAASAHAPLAWLRMEPTDGVGGVELRLRLWPQGTDTTLLRAHPHGERMEWVGAA